MNDYLTKYLSIPKDKKKKKKTNKNNKINIIDEDELLSSNLNKKRDLDSLGISINDPNVDCINKNLIIVIIEKKKHKKISNWSVIEDSTNSPPRKSITNSPSPPRKDTSNSPPRREDRKKIEPVIKPTGLIMKDEYSKYKKESEGKKKVVLDKTLTGENAQTIYRDKSGKKIQKTSEIMFNELRSRGIQSKEEEELEKLQWGLGKKQIEELEKKHEELEKAKERPFAVYADDLDFNSELKNELREEDPMAKFIETKKKSNKPEYKGPKGPTNRYGIKPGYRWDGVDRGNGFEREYLSKKATDNLNEEEKYKYLTRDM